MTGMTYDSLVEDLQNYSQRGNARVDANTLTEIPRIINRCEVGLARELKIQGDQITVTSTMDPLDAGVIYKPVDWLDTISINFGTGTNFNTTKFLLPRSYEYCVSFWPDRTEQDEPEYYSDYDLDHWFFCACPDLEYPFEVLYHGTPPLLTSSNQTNWLTEKMPDLLLNDALIALCGSYLGWKGDRLAPIQAARAAAAASVNTQDIIKVVDRATTRRSA